MYRLTLRFEKLGTACRFIDALNDADFAEITITKEKSETAAGNEDGNLANTDTDIVSENVQPVKVRSSPERNAAMFELWNAGWTAKKIADEYGVSEKTVYNVINKIKTEIGGAENEIV